MATKPEDEIVERFQGKTAAGKQEPKKEALTEDFLRAAAGLVERLAVIARNYAQENNLSQEEGAFAITLLYMNSMNDYPAELGGVDGFRKVAAGAEQYFVDNVDK